MSIAIVTGASSGMGAEFCRRLDPYGLDSIWLIARRTDLLESLASELKTPSRIFSIDLTDQEQLESICSIITDESPDIRYLINCAGFGKFGMTWELDPKITSSMIDLNVKSLVRMTDACIPYMRPGSHIIELCSASAYVALYDLNVYASTKAFVRHFCNGLREELRPKGISVTEVSPGWVKTDFIDITLTESDVPPKIFNSTVTKEDVVRTALRDADRGKKRSVCGLSNKMVVALSRFFPGIGIRVWAGQFK